MADQSVRTEFAYEVSMLRVGDVGLRAASFRLLTVTVVAILALLGHAPWFVALPIALAAFGGYLSATTNYYQIHADRNPGNPVTKWAFGLTLDGSGRMIPDVPGLTESLCYVPLVIIGPWFMSDSEANFRLGVLAASLAWVGSCLNAIFVDPGFYNPEVHLGWRYVDWARRYLLGPVVIAIAASVVLPADWAQTERAVTAGMCVLLGGAVQIRVRETDRLLDHSRTASFTREIVGRHTMVEAVHELVGPATSQLRIQLTENPQLADTLDEPMSDLEAGYSDVLSMEDDLDRDLDWPGRLQAYLDRLSRLRKVRFHLEHPELMHRVDRAIAHQVLHHLATNAVNARATLCSFALIRDGDFLVVRATDNGQPVARSAWMSRGSGLRRVLARLQRSGDGAAIELVDDGTIDNQKLIIARWRSHSPKVGEE